LLAKGLNELLNELAALNEQPFELHAHPQYVWFGVFGLSLSTKENHLDILP
jgi:hypothetical protein